MKKKKTKRKCYGMIVQSDRLPLRQGVLWQAERDNARCVCTVKNENEQTVRWKRQQGNRHATREEKSAIENERERQRNWERKKKRVRETETGRVSDPPPTCSLLPALLNMYGHIELQRGRWLHTTSSALQLSPWESSDNLLLPALLSSSSVPLCPWSRAQHHAWTLLWLYQQAIVYFWVKGNMPLSGSALKTALSFFFLTVDGWTFCLDHAQTLSEVALLCVSMLWDHLHETGVSRPLWRSCCPPLGGKQIIKKKVMTFFCRTFWAARGGGLLVLVGLLCFSVVKLLVMTSEAFQTSPLLQLSLTGLQ